MLGTRASLASLLVLAMLAGCSTGGSTTDAGRDAAPAADAAQANDGRCQASGADFAIGKQGTPELLEQARAASGAQIARLLTPRDMVTLEYRSERLNLNVNEQGVVNRVNCG
ncbi:I78 family peptidase inhibitor [Pseudomonas cremoricolorata]|uniref:Lipoprotein n=1 Tax=Pseudomonas cremoricolorata TaxID=157783 RepID=A0A089YGA0_9PSED|nr:I78 family peptidase inhibitor [Pseudomonas cremoricolorata]AIR90733.1 lipoprotein [Pseudomonas cremoricolorata]